MCDHPTSGTQPRGLVPHAPALSLSVWHAIQHKECPGAKQHFKQLETHAPVVLGGCSMQLLLLVPTLLRIGP
jgi:hypothetical protein